jgi:lipopolysaccharide biosynthesis glycosyltransferase
LKIHKAISPAVIELALAFNDRDGSYAEHAAVALTSVFRNTSSKINVHILHDETLTVENKLRLTQLASSFNHTINFYPVTLPAEMAEVLSGTASLHTWTGGSMYRILLPSLIPADKVIYLDCDVIVNLDIAELWAAELNGFYLGAILDPGVINVAENVTVLGLDPAIYFNSGVIVFELNNIRQKMNWYEDTLNFLRSFPGTTMPDQDVLNHVFGGNYLQLDQRFNSFYIHGSVDDFHQKIIHFAGDIKSWNPLSPGYSLYQNNFNLTPWRMPSMQLTRPVQSVGGKVTRRKISARGKHVLQRRKNRKTSLRKTGFIRKSRPLRQRKTIWASLNTTTSGTRGRSKQQTVAPRSSKNHNRSKLGSRP